jgi:hypothetical protein
LSSVFGQVSSKRAESDRFLSGGELIGVELIGQRG